MNLGSDYIQGYLLIGWAVNSTLISLTATTQVAYKEMGLGIHKLYFLSINNSEFEVQWSHLPLKQRGTRIVYNMKDIWPLVLPCKLKLLSFWHWEQRLWGMLSIVRRSLCVLGCKLIKCDYAGEQPAGEQPEAFVSSFLGQKTHRASESKVLLPQVPITHPCYQWEEGETGHWAAISSSQFPHSEAAHCRLYS